MSAFDISVTQRNAANTGFVTSTFPFGSVECLLSLNGSGVTQMVNRSAFATSAQGATADSALQPSAINSTIQAQITPGTTGQYFRGDKTWQNLATVSTTGDYNDLSNRPSIPAAQVNSDWSAVSGVTQILNKPSLGTAAAKNIGDFDASGAASAAQAFAIQRANQTGTQLWGTITATPTTLAGYGITDAYPLSGNPSSFITTSGARTAISLTTTGTSGAATYNSTTGALNVPNYAVPSARSFSTPTFSGITTAAQLSTTRDAEVFYDIDASVTISLLAGQSVTATLTYADNSGMSTNPVIVSSQTASNSGVLGLTQVNTLKLAGVIPAAKFRKVTFSTTGSGAVTPSTLKSGQEVLV